MQLVLPQSARFQVCLSIILTFSTYILTIETADVAAAVKCTSITLNGFTVPAGEGLTLSLASGTTVTMGSQLSPAYQV